MAEVLQEEQLRSLIRDECRAAVRDELRAMVATYLSAAAAEQRLPQWDMDIPELAAAIQKAENQADLLEIIEAEQCRPQGKRPNVLTAAQVRLQELDNLALAG